MARQMDSLMFSDSPIFERKSGNCLTMWHPYLTKVLKHAERQISRGLHNSRVHVQALVHEHDAVGSFRVRHAGRRESPES